MKYTKQHLLVYLIFLLTLSIKSAELKYDVYGYYDFLKFFKVSESRNNIVMNNDNVYLLILV